VTDLRAKVLYYGDDMTGATDAMANFAEWGLATRLVLDVDAVPAAAAEMDVVGVAGTARSLPSEAMAAELGPVLRTFTALDPPAVQYKICSTFDSTPAVGSIGRACELLRDVWGPGPIPVLAAQPGLGRWTFFGTHFASTADGRVHRLDRHPTMATHPVHPATEADLARALAAQTDRLAVASLHRPELERYPELSRTHDGPIVLDAICEADLRRIGALLWSSAQEGRPLVTVGSGGLSSALASAITRQDAAPGPRVGSAPVLALSGSLAGETRAQIERAVGAGWEVVDLLATAADTAGKQAATALAEGRSVVISSIGDPTRQAGTTERADGVGPLLTAAALAAIDRARPARVLVAGGDTSGTIMKGLGAVGLDYIARIGDTGAVCALRGGVIDGAQVVLKGGKIGGPEFFERVRQGR